MTDVLANHRRFREFLATRIGNQHDAEEILQDAFARGIAKTHQVRDEESTVAWFFRVLRNAITDHYRRQAAGKRAMEAYASKATEADPISDADLHRVICACIQDLIPNLKPEYAEMIRRIDLGEESVNTVVDALGLTPGNGRVRLHRAREALRHEVELACRTCAEHGCLDCTCAESKHKT